MNLDFLKRKRQEANKTQAEIAEALGMSPPSYYKIEKGENNLHPRHWAKLETLLGVTRKELCDFTAEVAITRRHRLIESGEVKPDHADTAALLRATDPFLQIVIDNWQKLTFEDRGRLAGIVRGMGEKKVIEPAPVTAICPKCGEKIREPHESGDRFECPKCGRHLKVK